MRPDEAPSMPTRPIWISFALICLLNDLNNMDRMVLASATPAIKAEFHLSDTRIGLLSASFAIVYAVCGVLFGRLADVTKRKHLIVLAGTMWSAMTALCGMAVSFWTLFAARIGVALGECGFSPTSYSLFSDYFRPAQRNWAIGIHNACSSLGVGIGLIAGGWFAAYYGWRMGFLVLGTPGLLLMIVAFFLIVEPKRGGMDGRAPQARPDTTLLADLTTLVKDDVFVWVVIAGGFNGFCVLGMVQWLPSFFERTHGMSLSSIGVQFGIAFALGLALGQFAGGLIGARLSQRNVFQPLILCVISNFLLAPLFLTVLWLPNPGVAMAVTMIATLAGALGHPVQAAAVQNSLPYYLRGMAAGIVVLFFSFFGMAFGPLLVGMTSDAFGPHVSDADALRYALTISQFIFVLAGVSSWLAYRAGQRRIASQQAALAAPAAAM